MCALMAGPRSEEIIPLGRFEKVKDEMRKYLAGTKKMLIGGGATCW